MGRARSSSEKRASQQQLEGEVGFFVCSLARCFKEGSYSTSLRSVIMGYRSFVFTVGGMVSFVCCRAL